MKIIRFLLIYLLVFTFFCSAQDDLKYWTYRKRLNEKFMLIGEPSDICTDLIGGYNLPISIFSNFPTEGSIFPKYGYAKQSNFINYYATLSDNSEINLGYLIGTLATEYYLLHNAGQSTEATLNELYYAIRAYERLDKKTELRWIKNPTSQSDCGPITENGFFIRDDVTEDFFREFYNKKYNIPYTTYDLPLNQGGFRSDDNVRNWSFTKAFTQSLQERDLTVYHRVNSRDNYVYMLMGFALVKKFVGSDVRCSVNPSFNITQEAINHVHRMYLRVSESGWVMEIPNTDPVEYIDSKDRTYGNMQIEQTGLAKAAEWVTGYSYDTQDYINILDILPDPTTDFWTNFISYFAPLPTGHIWNNAMQAYVSYVSPYSNAYPASSFEANDRSYTTSQYAIPAAVGNSWTDGVPIFLGPCPECLYLGNTGSNSTNEVLRELSDDWGAHIFYLLQCALHDETLVSSSADIILARLSDAFCDGSYFIKDSPSNNSWNQPNVYEKYLNSKRISEGNFLSTSATLNETREQSGLDYMLTHNLYKIAKEISYVSLPRGSMKSMLNVMDNTDHLSSESPLGLTNIITSVDDIHSTAIIENNADVLYEAREQIDLSVGFEAKTGSSFEALINDIDCDALALSMNSNGRKEFDNSKKDISTDSNLVSLKSYEIKIYPNPFEDEIKVNFMSETESRINISIINVQGSTLQSQIFPVSTANNNIIINTGSIPSGIYIIIVKPETGLQKIFKMVKS